MASLCILAFDHEGRPIQFDTWLDDLQLYLLSDSRDSVSLFDLESGTSPAPPATADSATCSQWLTHDAAARLAIRNHLPLQPASPLPAPSPYTEQSGSLTERREPASRLRVPLPAPPEFSLPAVHDLESDRASATSPTVSRLLATAVTDPSLKSAAASALVAELLDFAAACCLDYATALVAESASASPPSIGGECALGMDVLEDRQEEFECLAAAVPRFASMLHAPEGDPDAPDIPTPCSFAEAITGTYIDEVPPPGVNIVNGMWIFKVKRPPGSPPAFKARYVARCFSQRQGVDYFQAFSPTPKMTTLRVLLHVAAQRDYELHSLDFSTAFLYGSLHEEIWLRRPPGFIWSTTLAALGFVPSTADPSMFLRTDTLMPPFYVLVTQLRRAALPSRAAQPSHAALPSRASLPSHAALPSRAAPLCSAAASAATAATAASAATAAMASPTILTFDVEGRVVDFDVWVDDLQLFLQCDSRDRVSLFDHTSGVSTAPAATADNTVCSQWITCDAVARLAVRRHLPSTERAHFGQYKTAQSLYDAVVAR
ncbi:unnamed protein product [Closterium sp. NIES-54]